MLFHDLELTFQTGTILTAHMLEEVYGAPRDALSILYGEYPDGILAGTGLAAEKGWVRLKKGLVKFRGRIYRMDQDINLTEAAASLPDPGKTLKKLLFVPAEPEDVDGRPSQRRHGLRLAAAGDQDAVDGIEFARFKLHPSSRQIAVFDSSDTEKISQAVYWNMTFCPYACRGGATFHPYIFQALRKKLVRNRNWRFCVTEELAKTGVLSLELLDAILEESGTPVSRELPEPERRMALLKALDELPEEPVKQIRIPERKESIHRGKML